MVMPTLRWRREAAGAMEELPLAREPAAVG